jgi:hypothetical protein
MLSYGQLLLTWLLTKLNLQVMTLTNEGGRLKRDVMMVDGKDFKLVPEPVWKALSTWYGGCPALPRTVSTPFKVFFYHQYEKKMDPLDICLFIISLILMFARLDHSVCLINDC